MPATNEQLAAAEVQIAAVLAKLERETDALVDDIQIKQMEVTRMQDDRPQMHRYVKITMHRAPGSQWA